MAYQIRASVTIMWIGDGAGPMEVGSAQVFTATAGPAAGSTVPSIQVPGGNAPTSGNISTGCASLATAIAAVFNTAANLAQIQGFATGGG